MMMMMMTKGHHKEPVCNLVLLKVNIYCSRRSLLLSSVYTEIRFYYEYLMLMLGICKAFVLYKIVLYKVVYCLMYRERISAAWINGWEYHTPRLRCL